MEDARSLVASWWSGRTHSCSQTWLRHCWRPPRRSVGTRRNVLLQPPCFLRTSCRTNESRRARYIYIYLSIIVSNKPSPRKRTPSHKIDGCNLFLAAEVFPQALWRRLLMRECANKSRNINHDFTRFYHGPHVLFT